MTQLSGMLPTDWVLVVVGVTIGILLTVTLYSILFRNIIQVRMYRNSIALLILVALTHTIGTILQSQVLESKNYWFNYFYRILGVWTVTGTALCQLELLFLFSPLIPFWTKFRVRVGQLVLIFLHFGLFSISYLFPIFFPPWPGELYNVSTAFQDYTREHPLMQFYRYGARIFTLVASFMYTIKLLYIVFILYQNSRGKNPETMQYRIAGMIRFSIFCVLTLLSDWTGLMLYSSVVQNGVAFWVYISYAFLHLRVVLGIQLFLQLRTMTLVKDEMFASMLSPPQKIKFLTYKKAQISIHEKNTILVTKEAN
jgi:hypothetical protein